MHPVAKVFKGEMTLHNAADNRYYQYAHTPIGCRSELSYFYKSSEQLSLYVIWMVL